jgi:hypothetical protein
LLQLYPKIQNFVNSILVTQLHFASDGLDPAPLIRCRLLSADFPQLHLLTTDYLQSQQGNRAGGGQWDLAKVCAGVITP